MLNVTDVLDQPDTAPVWAVQSARWIVEVVGRPVPGLGRPGPLCPYVPSAVRARGLRLIPCELPADPVAALTAAVHAAAADFTAEVGARPATDALDRCDLIVFVGLAGSAQILTAVRRTVKPDLLRHGNTCGEFYPDSPDGSVRNGTVPVARSPWPMLAIRRSTPHDALFLAAQPDLRAIFEATGPGVPLGRPA